MRILIYIPQPGPTRAPEVVANLAKLGNEVIAISPPDRQMFDVGADIKPIKGTGLPFLGPILLIVFGVLLAISEIVRQKPDAIYTLGGSMATGLMLAKLFRCPLITEVNGWRRAELKLINKKASAMFVSRVSCWMDELEIKHSGHVIVVAPGIKQAVCRDLNVKADKITVIPNGANIELFRPISDARKILDLESDCYFVGFVGVLAPWQGLDKLIRSAPLILNEVPNTRFLLVGDGESKKEAIQLVDDLKLSKDFIFIGLVPYTEVPEYVNAMDVCVSFRKGTPASPLKLYEYAVCGKPIVATDDVDNTFVKEYDVGILVDPDELVEVANAIISLLKSSELREQMGSNGRRYVLERRNWRAVASEVEKVIKATINK